jgi:hypothetical protein
MEEIRKAPGEELLNAHAQAIGKVAMAWNELHEHLALIFANMFEPDSIKVALATWHSIPSDTTQREMLRSAAIAKLGKGSQECGEILWILDEIKHKLAKQRNTGIHMPIVLVSDNYFEGEVEVAPYHWFGNRRAADMVGKNLLDEYAHYEAEIIKAHHYAAVIQMKTHPGTTGDPLFWLERPNIRAHPER